MTENNLRKTNRGWTTRDIMVTAIISIALGVLYIPITYLISWLTPFIFIVAIVIGIYFWPIILVAYLIRKPGAAFFSALVSFIVLVPFTPYGITVLMMAVLLGLPIEAALLVGRYKFKLWSLMLAGAVTGVIYVLGQFVVWGLVNVSPMLQVVIFIEAIISGALLGGLLAKWIGDAVFKTGVISNPER